MPKNKETPWETIVDGFAVGCYADGAAGHVHVRSRIANLLEDLWDTWMEVHRELPPDCEAAYTLEQCIADLRGEMSDDAYEEEAAQQWLNDYCCPEGACWEFYNGDFGLYEEETEGGVL